MDLLVVEWIGKRVLLEVERLDDTLLHKGFGVRQADRAIL
jgi:hypothetical protein